MISREDAVYFLIDLCNNDCLKDEITDTLSDIANLIELEGNIPEIDAFGIDHEDYSTLVSVPLHSVNGVVVPTYREHEKKCEEIIKKYRRDV